MKTCITILLFAGVLLASGCGNNDYAKPQPEEATKSKLSPSEGGPMGKADGGGAPAAAGPSEAAPTKAASTEKGP